MDPIQLDRIGVILREDPAILMAPDIKDFAIPVLVAFTGEP